MEGPPETGGRLAMAGAVSFPVLAQSPYAAAFPATAHRTLFPSAEEISPEALTVVVRRVCGVCHNAQLPSGPMGNLVLTEFDVAKAAENAEVAEKMIRKLRAQMMPPPGIPRPGGDTMQALVETLETLIDEAVAAAPNPGDRPFQRMNRAEYEASIRDLLGLQIDAGAYLPLDTKSANFDNIADVQTLSPTLLSAYLNAAAEISRLAVGNPSATASEATYTVPRTASQTTHVEGAPYGTRGGIAVVHNFPADGEYSFRVSFYHETTGGFVGGTSRGEKVEISIDGERAVVLDVDRFMRSSDPNQTTMYTDPIKVTAGPHRLAAAFIPPHFQDAVQDLISPLDWSLASTAIDNTYGFSLLPHMRDVVVLGPYRPSGVSDSPVRDRIFTCRPASPAEEATCAREIVSRLATRAFRRPLAANDVDDLMAFYEAAAAKSGFETGVRSALEAILASPDFVFRFEPVPNNARPGQTYPVSDISLASRLSFFLWSSLPDEELLNLAREGRLSNQEVLDQQVKRMLADPRSEALATRFAGQWLRLEDLDKVFPDVRQYTDFDEQLRESMRRETELFFDNLVREDRSVLELYTADYTFVNERLARHYGIPGVAGTQFQRVQYPDDTRRGILGHGSVLVQTSHANRSSPVLRGKWVMEVLLNTPPPPPPPGVPDLEATAAAQEGRLLTTRERMEMHRANAVCRSCHQFMDPIGLALDNFDVTGKWRIKENGMPLDTKGQLYDGTPVENPGDLREALLKRPTPLLRTFTENLMAYALGRRVEPWDMPTVRAIVREGEGNDHRISTYIMGVINSPAFRMQRLNDTALDVSQN
jgi:cytochrome c553